MVFFLFVCLIQCMVVVVVVVVNNIVSYWCLGHVFCGGYCDCDCDDGRGDVESEWKLVMLRVGEWE